MAAHININPDTQQSVGVSKLCCYYRSLRADVVAVPEISSPYRHLTECARPLRVQRALRSSSVQLGKDGSTGTILYVVVLLPVPDLDQ